MLKFFILFCFFLVIILNLFNYIFSINNPYKEKLSPYECGMNPLGDARQKFYIQFFLIAILFLVFDLEIILLFPFVISFNYISISGFLIGFLFLIILTIGFIYEFSQDALKF
jgi:NADH:ubiquinone oxidoreductase subunit 3 (subunit A)